MVINSREEDDDWVTVATLSSHSNTVWDLAWDPAGLGQLFRDFIASHQKVSSILGEEFNKLSSVTAQQNLRDLLNLLS